MNNKNDRNNNDFAGSAAFDIAAIFELDDKFLEIIGGGIGGDVSGPVVLG